MGSLMFHGGFEQPIDRIVPVEEREDFVKKVSSCKRYHICDGDISSFYGIGEGILTPLEGPMNSKVFEKVLYDEVITMDGCNYAWTIPISFPISESEAKGVSEGEELGVYNGNNTLLGSLIVEDVFKFNKQFYIEVVYGTPRHDHPGAHQIMNDSRDYLIGGYVQVLPRSPAFIKSFNLFSPRFARKLFKEKEWERIIAFQTRNPLHRAHEYAMVVALERVMREGHYGGVVLNPLVGQTKSDDIPALVRMQCYKRLVEGKLLGVGDVDASLWQSRDASIEDHVVLIGLDMRMHYAGPKEAIMHAIYRQNLGCTDIIIGRRHADAPFDDGTPIWGDFEAQEIFNQLKGELLIKNLNVGYAAYYEEAGKVCLVEDCEPRGWKPVTIAGSKLRSMLKQSVIPDGKIMRPEISEILVEYYKNCGNQRG